jgi:hypothetical protein
VKAEQLISGALFDFAASLTAGEDRLTEAPEMIERLREWAGQRGLDLDEAEGAVQTWQDEIGVKRARRTIAEAFVKDPDFRRGYVDNIAVRLSDELRGAPNKIFNKDVRDAIADRMVKLLFES